MRYCEYCGAQRSDTAKYCSKCGNKVGNIIGHLADESKADKVQPQASEMYLKPFVSIPFGKRIRLSLFLAILISIILLAAYLFRPSGQDIAADKSSQPLTINSIKTESIDAPKTIPPTPLRDDSLEKAKALALLKQVPVLNVGPLEPVAMQDFNKVGFGKDGKEYSVAIDEVKNKIIVKVFNEQKQLVFEKEVGLIGITYAVPFLIERIGSKQSDLVLYRGAKGSGAYLVGVEVIGEQAGRIKSLLSSDTDSKESWKDGVSAVQVVNKHTLVKSKDGRVYMKYRRRVEKWNGPEVSKPSKEYARELMWNASRLVYELGPEYFLEERQP